MLKRIAGVCYRRRWLVLAAWVVVLIGINAVGGAAGSKFSQSFNLPATDSQKAFDLLDARFPARAGETAFVVFKGTPSIDTQKSAVNGVLDRLRKVNGIIDVRDLTPSPSNPQIAFAEMQFASTPGQHRLSGATVDAVKAIAADHQAGLQIELSGQFGEPPSFGLSELVGVGAAIVILLITFGSLLAMGLPILNAMFGLGVGLAGIALVTHLVSVPEFAPQLAIMIGLGVGIDYALFIITRFRQGIHAGLEPETAVVKAISTSGKAVFFAGCTVIISLAGMYLIGIDFVSGLATGALIAVAMTIATSLTLLPAILGFVGKNIDRLHVPGVSRGEHERDGFWYRWSRIIQRRPLPFAIGALLVLLVLASPVSTIQLGSSDDGNRPPSDTTRRAYDLLADGFGPGFNGPLLLAFEVPSGVGDSVLTKVHDAVAATPGVQFALPATFNPQHDTAVMQVFPTTSPQDPKTVTLIHHLRADVLPSAVQGTGVRAHVGGITAAFEDVSTYVQDRLPFFIGLVLLLSFLLLLVVFRSLLVPLKAVIMNLLSIGAAYGALVGVFQKGIGASIINVKQGPIESFLPMMLFAILFGLSMDSEVFLLSRVKEEYDRTRNNAAAVADGVNATARVITAAALIMVLVFGSFMFGDDRVLKEFGFGLAVAIFVDATIVRMVLVPATMELLGDANWWLPKWLDRILPNVHIEGEPDLDHEIEALLDKSPVASQ
ncbi:MAG TPA: MMPL family transporter [Acidimicrobiales bacterium]|nr:MMPL family transporter [Acidimicrobiales bacterium]